MTAPESPTSISPQSSRFGLFVTEFDDDLLPDNPSTPTAPSQRPRGPDGKFLASTPETPEPVVPQHSPLVLSMAQELGVDNPSAYTPPELEKVVSNLRRQRAQLTTKAPVVEEDPIDWGDKEDGTPIKTEAEYVAEYGRANARALKRAHEANAKVEKISKEYTEFKQTVEQERQERIGRQVTRDFHRILAERPDLFGEKPGQAKEGSAEAKRYALVRAHLTNLLTNKQHTTLDADTRSAMELFGVSAPEPQTKSPQSSARPTLTDYERAEVARATNRRGTEQITRRELLIRQKEEELAEKNGQPYYAPVGPADDDDLLD